MFDASDNNKSSDKMEEINIDLEEPSNDINYLLESLNGLIFTYDTQEKFTYLNAKLLKLLGYEPKNIIGRYVLDFVVDIEKEKVQAEMRSRLDFGAEASYELSLITKDSTCRIFRINSAPLIKNGEIQGGIVIVEDITESKQLEDALNKKNAQMQVITENMEVLVAQVDLAGKYISVNSSYKCILGYDSQNLLGQTFYAFLHPDDTAAVSAVFLQAINNKSIERMEYRFLCANGTYLWLETVGDVLLENGQVCGGILASRDISIRKEAEKALKETRQRMVDIIEFLPDATLVIDLEGKVIAWNRAMEKTTGIKAADMLGKGDYEYALPFYGIRRPILIDLVLHPGIKPERVYGAVYREGNILVGESLCSALGESGEYMWGTARTLYNTSGQLTGAIESIRNITDRKAAEKELLETRQRMADIIEFLPDATVVIDLESKVIAWNRAVEKMTGIKAADMLGKGDYEYALPFYGVRRPTLIDLVLHPDSELEQKYESIHQEDQILAGESFCPNIGKSGEYLFGTASTLRNTSGKRIGAIESVRNITDKKNAEFELKNSYETVRHILEGTVNALSMTAEKRDPYTAGHQRRVADLACAIAKEMGICEEDMETIRIGAILHDLGKMFIPNDILSKPGELNDIEMLMIKTHPQAGYDIVKPIAFHHLIGQIILQHHERLDGSGYPNGISGSDIIMEARIIAVADVVEAMTFHRPYRSALGLDRALEEIKQNKGTRFDLDVVQACLALFTNKGFKFE
ncbi:MAG: hypothetical protein CVU90_01560 [Firmicutes bacterium HGW-Firmicutes-15]|nr:MAG: hypothetical protein CVU90_01560 [Firmicutes bacterium HGW-Firmicutes-15]